MDGPADHCTPDNYQHVIVATDAGALTEMYCQGGHSPRQSMLMHFDSRIVAIAGYASADGCQDVSPDTTNTCAGFDHDNAHSTQRVGRPAHVIFGFRPLTCVRFSAAERRFIWVLASTILCLTAQRIEGSLH
jgi:hypothetical protein